VVGCFIVIFAVIFVAEHAHGRCVRRCERYSHSCLGIGCIAPAMILISIVVSAELSLGILASAFCVEADRTAMRYAEAKFGNDSRAFNLTRYYVVGHGTNPALEHLDEAQGSISKSMEWMEKYGAAIARTCPQWGSEKAALLNLGTVKNSLNASTVLLMPDNMYPYYRESVHELVCERTISGLGSVAVLQLALGLVCLPALLCTASCIVESLSHERSHGFGLLSQDEDETGEMSSVEAWVDHKA